MISPSHAIAYRPEIDGLRAIAVLAVVFYHAGLGCPGGYVGVDVFFVISGYLITSLILKDLRQGTFSLAAFWERRIRRIFPASAVCVLVTLVAGFFLLLPDDLENLGKSAIAQTLMVANFYFWRTTNYFGGANEEKPLLHTWSLAVEEQFYLFFPLLLLLLFRFPGFRRPGRLIGLMLAGAAISLALAMWGVTHQPFATFFLLPTRVWELLCGAIIAALPATAIPQSRWLREGGSWLGLAAILAPVWLYNEKTLFPGLAALPPCIGTALLIWANGANAAGPPPAQTLPARILSLRAVVFIGLISYSLYLWHWPVIAFSKYWGDPHLAVSHSWFLVGLSFVLALGSWRYVETPFRRKQLSRNGRVLTMQATACSLVILLAGSLLSLNRGYPRRLPESTAVIDRAIREDGLRRSRFGGITKNADIKAIDNDLIPNFGAPHDGKSLDMVLLGDSHAWGAVPIFDKIAKSQGLSASIIAYQSTPPLLGWQHRGRFGMEDPDALWAAAIRFIARNKTPDTFLLANWGDYQQQGGVPEFRRSMQTTIDSLTKTGTRVWIVMPHPTYDQHVPKTLMLNACYPALTPGLRRLGLKDYQRRNPFFMDIREYSSKAVFLDPSPILFDASTQIFKATVDGVPLYFDGHHLTIRGTEIALEALITKALDSSRPRTGS